MMKFLRLGFCILVFFCSVTSWAGGRILPTDTHIVMLKQSMGNKVVLGSLRKSWVRTLTLGMANGNKTFMLSKSVRVHDTNNRFITYNNLSNFKKVPIAVRFDNINRIQEIWILTDQEVDSLVRSDNPQVN